jgi:hypothetical protein
LAVSRLSVFSDRSAVVGSAAAAIAAGVVIVASESRRMLRRSIAWSGTNRMALAGEVMKRLSLVQEVQAALDASPDRQGQG